MGSRGASASNKGVTLGPDTRFTGTKVKSEGELLAIDGGKNYKEIVLRDKNGKVVADLVYEGKKATRAPGNMSFLKTELATYGLDAAKELADYYDKFELNRKTVKS